VVGINVLFALVVREKRRLKSTDLNDNWKSLKMCIMSAADEVIGKAPQEGKKAWFDEECQETTN
jgi:hypothetical protein